MTNEQRKSLLKELYINPLLIFDPPNKRSWQPKCWLCKSCAEYSCYVKWGEVRLFSYPNPKNEDKYYFRKEGHPDLLVWQFEDGKTDIIIDSQTGNMVEGNDEQLRIFDDYLFLALTSKKRKLEKLDQEIWN